MAQSLLEYIIRSKKEGDAAKQAAGDLQELEQQSQSTSKSTELLGKAWGIAQGALIAGGVALIASVPALLDQGNAIEKAETALIGYTGSAEKAEQVIRAVEAAAGGSITKFEATQNANRLFAMGLANTADEAAKLTEMAITLGAAMGSDAKTSFENFSLMLANQSIPRLDTFGISGAAVRERMAELTKEIEGLDRQTAFMMATMEIGTDALNSLNEAGFQAVDNVGRLKTEMGNLKDSLATTVANGLMPIIDGFYYLKDAIGKENEAIIKDTDSYDAYLERIAQLKQDHPILFAGTEELTRAEWAAARATEEMSDETRILSEAAADADIVLGNYTGSIDGTTDSLDDNAESANNAAGAHDNLAISLNKVTEATIARESLAALKAMMDEGTISADEYALAAHSILVNLGGFTSAEADATVAMAQLKEDYEDGTITALEYFSAVQSLVGQINAIPREVTTTYRFQQVGSPPGQGGKKDKEYVPYQAGGQFVVTGPAGIDQVPVEFMATRGEIVTITPQGRPTPGVDGGGIIIDARGAQFFGIGGIQEFADQLRPYMENAQRYG